MVTAGRLARTVLKTYAMILFSQDLWFGALLLAVTFFNPVAGLCGLTAVILSLLICTFSGFKGEAADTGLFSYNALLTGIGMGTFYETGTAFFVILFTAVLFSVMLSVAMSGWLGKYGLPFLTLPFVFIFWLVLLSGNSFTHLGLTQRNVYWLNEMYAAGGNQLVHLFNTLENGIFPEAVSIYFRSLSAIFFQGNVAAGIFIAAGLLFYSRIAFSLSILGFACAYGFGTLTGDTSVYTAYYHLGGNYMMSVIAIAGFFTIPSSRSYLWGIWTVPLVALLISGLGKISGMWLLPVFSLPFCIVVIVVLYFFRLRIYPGKPDTVFIQHYSPEKNLYVFVNGTERLKDSYLFRFFPPFIGQWVVSQGYDGNITHKGDWSKALDFMILDDEMKTYSGNGTQCRDYYCYAKPVLAPGDGIVEEAVDGVEENAIGNVNMVQNWGNTIVIRHLPGLYTKLSHLKNGSLKVKKGDFVRKGDIIAQCGNSGRSPEPHIHFQVQAFPDVAARTLSYPLAYYFLHEKGKTSLESFSVPAEGKIISAAETSTLLGAAFAFQPGFRQQFVFSENKKQKKESWETVTDAYNRTYIYVVGGNAYAYFINNGTVFYFTAFYGDKNSLLYRFYLSCYHIPLVQYGNMNATDHFPLHLFAGGPAKWLQDVVAPFHVFVRKEFRMECAKSDDEYHPREITLSSSIRNFFPGRSVQSSGSEITVADGKIRRFRFSDMENGNIIDAECTEEK